jgi:ParB-like chromosome segregation protein Spo0J
MRELCIDPEFLALIPPLSATERQGLEASILAEGCREPLIVWEEKNILVDGHNRYEICTAHGIGFQVVTRSFPDRASVMDWMIDNQLSRRNLPPMLLRYLRGKRYLLEKQQGKRHDLTSAQIEQKLTTDRKLAKQYGVSASTIRRDASFAHDVDTLSAALSPQSRQAILSRDSKLTQQDTQELAKVARHSPEKVPQLVAQLVATFCSSNCSSNRKPRSKPTQGISYTPGVGCDYQIAVTAQVWEQLNNYKEAIGAATLSGALARLLDEVKQNQLSQTDAFTSVEVDVDTKTNSKAVQSNEFSSIQATTSWELNPERLQDYEKEEIYNLIVEAENIAAIMDGWLLASRQTRSQVRQLCPGIELVIAGKFAEVYAGKVPRAFADLASNDRAAEIDALQKEKEQLAQAVKEATQEVRNLEQQLLQAKQKILAQGN